MPPLGPSTRFTATAHDARQAQAACGSRSGQVAPPAGPTGPAVAFAGANPTCVEERLGALVFRVELDEVVGTDVEVPFTLGGSVSPDDFSTQTVSPLIVPAGETEALLRIAFPDDGEFELDEELLIQLGTPTGAVLGSASSHTVTIKHFEIEPNDNVPEARTVGSLGQVVPGFGVDVHGAISEASDDFDTFRFEATQDVVVQASLQPENSATDVVLWFTDEDGTVTLVLDDAAAGGDEVGTHALSAGEVFHLVVLATGPQSDYAVGLRGFAPLTGSGGEDGIDGLDPRGGSAGWRPPLAWARSWSTLRDVLRTRRSGAPFEPRVVDRLRIDVVDSLGGARSLEIETQLVD